LTKKIIDGTFFFQSLLIKPLITKEPLVKAQKK